MRRGLWVGAVALVVAAAISIVHIFGGGKQTNAVLLDSEFQENFIQPSVSLSYDGYWAWLAGDVACTEGERVETRTLSRKALRRFAPRRAPALTMESPISSRVAARSKLLLRRSVEDAKSSPALKRAGV
jgi:hypothetical protein